MMATQGRSRTFRILTSLLVSLAAGFRVFTRGALRDDVKTAAREITLSLTTTLPHRPAKIPENGTF